MQLRDYPSVVKAFKEIDLESHGSHYRKVNGKAEIPARLYSRISMAESVLSAARAKKMAQLWYGDIPAKKRERMLRVGISARSSAFQIICNPVDNAARVVIKALGFDAKHVRATEYVLNEYFDGESDLSDLFTIYK